MINCPSCGYENQKRGKCIRCGCYLPVLLEYDSPPHRVTYHQQTQINREVPSASENWTAANYASTVQYMDWKKQWDSGER